MTYELAIGAARDGDWTKVRSLLSDMPPGSRSIDADALLASAWFHGGDTAAAEATADRVLVQDARNLRAVIVKAEALAAKGATREANLFFRAAVELGESGKDLAPDLAEGVARARQVRNDLARDLMSHVRKELDLAGFWPGATSSRFTHAWEIATGVRQPFFQQPQAFYFPELANTQFFPRSQFPWLDAIEAATGDILSELNAVLADDAAFAPYIQSVPNLPSQTDYPLVDSMDWSACFLWKDGKATDNAHRCPRTMEVLEQAPLCRIPGRSPQIMFSLLKPGAHIRPHVGFVNTRLVCHLPLIAPPNCRFRVGNEIRQWEAGKAWVFDDTIEHEAINQSDRPRVVLIFDIWRPELTPEERDLVTTLLEAMDAYSPAPKAWD